MTNCEALKELAEQLANERRFLALTLDNIPDAVTYIDEHLICRQCNAAAARYLGRPEREITGRHLHELVSDKTIIDALTSVLTTGKPVDASLVSVKRSDRPEQGETHYLFSYVPDMDASGKVRGVFASGRDVTELINARQAERKFEADKREFYRRTILAATDGKLIISEKEETCTLTGSPIRAWNVRNVEEFNIMRDEVRELASKEGMEESRIYNFLACVVEAAGNAVKHANGGVASLARTNGTLFFCISDKGPGIEALILPKVALVKGYSTAGTMGMGYKLMIGFADKVYLSTDPTGTTVGIEMKLRNET